MLYDSHEAIRDAITSLRNLNALIRERHQAGYVRKERLQEWVVLGRFYFDSCGNCWKYTGGSIPAEVFPDLPKVMRQTEFSAFIKRSSLPSKTSSFTCSIGDDIPPADLFCPECGTHWTVQNCHDTVIEHETRTVDLNKKAGQRLVDVVGRWKMNGYAVWRLQPGKSIRNDIYIDSSNKLGWIEPEGEYFINPGDEALANIWTYRHHKCHRQNQLKREQEYFQKIFTEAGFQEIWLSPIENKYCPCNSCAPWFEVVVNSIHFTIGWRKRVISIQSTDPRIVFDKIFPKEDVTKSPHEIHAWGREKCIEYLSTIRKLVK